MPIKYSKLSKYKMEKLLRCFGEDLTATQTAGVLGINRNTVNRYYWFFREQIAPTKSIKLSDRAFAERSNWTRVTSTPSTKTPVFGRFKRTGAVYTQILQNASAAQIRPIIRRPVQPSSTLYTDQWKAYDGLVLNGYEHHRIDHDQAGYSDGKGGHINGIESFWSFAKR